MKRFIKDGSYTVEAAFIIPLIFMIIFSAMALAFYLHDQVVLIAWEEECLSQARMAKLYEKVPYESTLSWEKISSNEDYIEAASLDNNASEKKLFFIGEITDASIDFSNEELAIDGHFSHTSPFFRNYYLELDDRYFEAGRDCVSHINTARYTTLIYRLIRNIFKG